MVYSIKSFLQVYKNLTIYNSIIKCFSYILSYIRAGWRLPKCISKNLARQVQKNLRNINWYSCYVLTKTVKFHTYLFSFMILVSCPEWSRLCCATCYKIFLNIIYRPSLRRCSLIWHIFFRVCLRRFVARERFLPQALLSMSFNR